MVASRWRADHARGLPSIGVIAARAKVPRVHQPPRDPVAYAAKFLWVWSMLPGIFVAIVFASSPRRFFEGSRPLVLVLPLLVIGLGFGVHGRSRAAVWAGLALFALIGAGALVGAAVAREPRLVIWVGIVALPVMKLLDAHRALR